MQHTTLHHTIPVTLLLVLITGCRDDEALQRQAEQNAQMARHAQQIVETSRKLVEADAKARGELIELQQNLQESVQTERKSLDHQHEELEAERQTIAHQRHRDPLIAAAIVNTGILLACIAPLLLAFWVLRNSWGQESASVDELLIHELTTETPVMLPQPTLPLVEAEGPLELARTLNRPTAS
jgi:uncharacterized protein YcfL